MQGQVPAQRVSSSDDSLIAFGLIVAVLIAGGWFVWYRYHTQIAAGVIAVQHWHMHFIGLFSDRYRTLDAQVLALNPADVSARTLLRLCHLVGLFFRIPVAAGLGGLAILCLMLAAPSRFTRTLDLARLMRIQAEVFGSIGAFVGRNLRPARLADGPPRPLDPALHVHEWIDRYARRPDGTFDEDCARRELTTQLGPLWQGPRRAAPHVRCLFAAFALQSARQRNAALAFLGDIAGSLSRDHREDPSGPPSALEIPPALAQRADAILARPPLVDGCSAVASRHAFTATAMMSVLCEARRKAGVLAPAQFNFLKLIDRRLWYALHSLGFPGGVEASAVPMPNPRVEAAGARDHWAAECQAGRPLRVPSIDRAALAIRAAVNDAGHDTTTEEPS